MSKIGGKVTKKGIMMMILWNFRRDPLEWPLSMYLMRNSILLEIMMTIRGDGKIYERRETKWC
jgi:hypothetical protein